MRLKNILTVLSLTLGVGLIAMCVGVQIERYRQDQEARSRPKSPVGTTWEEKITALSFESARIGHEVDDRTGAAIRWGLGGMAVGFLFGIVVAVRAKPDAVPVRSLKEVSFEGIRDAEPE